MSSQTVPDLEVEAGPPWRVEGRRVIQHRDEEGASTCTVALAADESAAGLIVEFREAAGELDAEVRRLRAELELWREVSATICEADPGPTRATPSPAVCRVIHVAVRGANADLRSKVEGLRVAEAEAMLVLESVEARLGAELVRTADLRAENERLRETVRALREGVALPWAMTLRGDGADVWSCGGETVAGPMPVPVAQEIVRAANRAMEV